jgi:hypothetical protein
LVKFESEVWNVLLCIWKVHDKRIELYSLVGILLAFEYGLLVVFVQICIRGEVTCNCS